MVLRSIARRQANGKLKKNTLQPSKKLNIKGPDHLFPGRGILADFWVPSKTFIFKVLYA